MKEMSDRLREAREKAGYSSATKAAEALGISPSTYRAHENGQNEFGYKEAERYARKFGADLFWLISGKQKDPVLVQAAKAMTEAHKAKRKEQYRDHAVALDLLPAGDVAELEIHGGMGGGGLLHVQSDGNGNVAPEYIAGHWSFPDHVKAHIKNLKSVYAFPVTGDSMEPTIAGGSIVFVDTSHNVPSPPDLYAVDYGDGLVVKRIELVPMTEGIRVISDNERYRTYDLSREDVRVYGRVVASFQWRG